MAVGAGEGRLGQVLGRAERGVRARGARWALLTALLSSALWPQGCDCDENLNNTECNFTVEPAGPSEPIEFGEVEVDRERSRPVRITNTGNVRLAEFSFDIAERNGTHYRISGGDDLAVELGGSEDINVIFHPLAESTNLGSSFTVSHAPIGGEGGAGCPAFQVVLDGSSFERIQLPDGGTPDGGGPDGGDGDGDGGILDGGDADGGDGDGDGDLTDAGPITIPDAGFDPDDTLEFQARGALQEGRSHFAAAPLADGTVLVVGGYGENGQAIDSVERFDPATGIATVVGRMAVPRGEPGAVELPSGLVAIVGGVSAATGGLALTTIEVWNPNDDDVETSVSCVVGQGDCLLDDVDQGLGLLPVGRLDPLVVALEPDVDAGLVPDRFVVLLGRTLDMDAEVLATGGDLVDLTNPTPLIDPLPGADAMPGRIGEARVVGPTGSFVVVGGQAGGNLLTDVWGLDSADPAMVAIPVTVLGRSGGAGAVLENGDVVLAGGLTSGGMLPTDLERIVAPFTDPEVVTVDVEVAPRVGGSLVALPGDVLLWAGGTAGSTAGLDVDESIVPLATADLLVPFFGDSYLRVAPDNQLATPRFAHRALAFGDGPDGVLFLGGVATVPRRTPHPAAERYALATNQFEVWGLMGPGTAFEAMANSGEGAILTAGGVDPHTGALSARSRVYSLDDDSFTDAPALREARRDHTVTRLADNAAYLVAGGRDAAGQILGSASIYVPLNSAGFDEPLPASLQRPRADHTATALDDGRVLLCGGVGTGGEALDTCEIFVPPPQLQNPGTYNDAHFDLAAGRLAIGRVGHTATLLDTGHVLLVGGGDIEQEPAAGDLFDPDDDTLDETGSPTVARRHHTAHLLGSGRVLIVGGEVYLNGYAATAAAEVYEHQNEIFIPVGDMVEARTRPGTIAFADGSVLIVGGAQEDDEDFPTRSLRLSERYVPDPFGLGFFEAFDLPLTYGRSNIRLHSVFGRGAVSGGDHRDGRLGTGAERRTPVFFVDRLVDLTE